MPQQPTQITHVTAFLAASLAVYAVYHLYVGGRRPRGPTAGPARGRRPWANGIVARLATGDRCDAGGEAPEYAGLVLTASWPMPAAVLAQYHGFAAELRAAMPAGAYVYVVKGSKRNLCGTECIKRGSSARVLVLPGKVAPGFVRG